MFYQPIHSNSWPDTINVHGQVGWMPGLLGGEESRHCNRIYITRKPRPVGGRLYPVQNLTG
jgi:hypothetical protein